MDKRTAEALEKSIEHWEGLAKVQDRKSIKIGPQYCALCDLFNSKDNMLFCEGCPVSAAVKGIYCYHTPYENARDDYYWWDLKTFKKSAQEELDFLKSLREEK